MSKKPQEVHSKAFDWIIYIKERKQDTAFFNVSCNC